MKEHNGKTYLEGQKHDMAELLDTLKPDAMAVEELFFNNNITTGIGVAQARGVILAEGQRHGVEIFEYSPSEVKLAVTGYGKAEKRQVMDMTKRLLLIFILLGMAVLSFGQDMSVKSFYLAETDLTANTQSDTMEHIIRIIRIACCGNT